MCHVSVLVVILLQGVCPGHISRHALLQVLHVHLVEVGRQDAEGSCQSVVPTVRKSESHVHVSIVESVQEVVHLHK